MSYRIREVKTFKHIQNLNERIFPGEPYKRHNYGYYWLVFNNDRPVGFAGMHICSNTKEYDTVFLSRSGVIKAHRGKGLGNRLLRVRINLCKKLEVKTIITYTIDNIPSANNLISMGFRIYDPDYRYGGLEAIHWRMDL